MFSIKESLRQGLDKFKANLELSLLATLFMGAVTSLAGKDHWGSAFLVGLAFIVLAIILRMGYTKMFLEIHDGRTPKFVDIFKEYPAFWRYLGVSILTPLAVMVGLVLFIVPGIILAVRLAFASIIVIDTTSGPIASLKESWAITQGHFWKLLGFWLVLILLNVLGFFLFFVGLLVTLPVSTLAAIYVYRHLTNEKAAVVEPVPATPVATLAQ